MSDDYFNEGRIRRRQPCRQLRKLLKFHSRHGKETRNGTSAVAERARVTGA